MTKLNASLTGMPELAPNKHEVLFNNEWCRVAAISTRTLDRQTWCYDLQKPDGEIIRGTDPYMMVTRKIGEPETER